MYTGTQSPEVPEVEKDVQHELGVLGSRIEELHKLLSELESEISPVLKPEAPDATKDVRGAPEPLRSPIAATVVGYTLGVASASRKIRSLMDRVQV